MNERKINTRIRLKQILSYYGVSENSLANGDKATQKRLNRQLKDSEITLDTILLFVERFPDVSAEWLLSGNGEMFKKVNEEKEKKDNINCSEQLEKVIADMQRQMHEMNERINKLQRNNVLSAC